jgi:hypothetical protein
MATGQVVKAESDLSRRPPSPDVTRRELERSLLYSEELGIDLTQPSEAVYFR